ncbi:uncharacterized protein LOC124328476 [Daphnia pulicaria]|uniref:uncharacterized protein LOC124328476 n=1 Tax=Daphnia pulicaria TaxID=35523 RepID=UPI001EEC2A1A|nr:uncharacterized protein LOC124328476 [Daphnia pulicaria]
MAEKIEQTSDTSTAPVTDGTKSSRGSTRPPPNTHSKGIKKARDGSHGLKFETKLLTLFCVRGLSAGYKFELGKENEDLAGKFDDVIFRYEVPDETPAGKHWRYHYLQAKHKENEKYKKITANDLIDPNLNGPFSLKKYFLSYCKMRERGDDVRDCIVCTNWDVNIEQFKKIQLEEVKEQHDILKFAPGEKTVGIYKLKIDQNLRSETIKLLEVADVKAMGMKVASLPDTFEIQFRNRETTNSNEDKMLTIDLITEKIVDSETKKFRPDFINDENLSVVANKFRQKMCQMIDDFYTKLIFVVNMPNETHFKKIIETEDVSKYYPSDMCKIQTTRIFDEISDAFEKKPANFWLTSEEAKKILLAGVTAISLEYQKQLEEEVEFNEDAIKVMEKKLRHLMVTTGSNKIQRISTPSPQHTAVKVISAVQIIMRELKQEGNYLVISSSRLQNEAEMAMWKNILKLQKGFHHFFVFVCDDEASKQNYENVISDDEADEKNIIIIIGLEKSSSRMDDEIEYTDLSKDFQEAILSKPISLQGKNVTVEDLVGDKPEEVIDFNSMKELLLAENEVKIPSFKTSNFDQSLYVERTLRFPFENQFELGGEYRISPQGHIEWLVEKSKQKEVWEKIMNGITNQASSTGKIVEDMHLTNLKEKENEKSIVIISGVAGTGKSTLLCHYYEEIKKSKPDHWVIRINLVGYEAFLKLGQIADFDVIDLFINKFHVVDDKSSFSRSLLRKRLETGDRIVVMFDGFDEINELCQKGAIQLMKIISKNKSIRLYVTTRTHMSGDLQFQLSQLAYNLKNFTEKDQVDYLTSYWVKELKDKNKKLKDESLQQFAKLLVERVSETLKDEEKSFIGIPLQCRILAECFQSNVKELITLNCAEEDEYSRQSVRDKISCLLDGQKFDLISLFNRLMETKRKVFCEEKAKMPSVENKVMTDAINYLIRNVESHLTKLAIKTIVEDQKFVDVLWPLRLWNQSNVEVAAEEKMIAMNSLSFGLIIENRENHTKAQFLHRTYAEYLFARYLYEGFLLDDEQHNKLLENESIQKLILNKILSIEQYDGVQVFFNGMLKELVDSTEWRNRIILRDLPERFTKFAKHLFTQFLRKYPSSLFRFQKVTEERSRMFPNALCYSISTGKEKIFKFFCDFLEATFDKKLIQNAMMNSFMTNRSYFSFKFFRRTESELFKRFIGYLYSDDSKDPASNADTKFNWHEKLLPPCDLEYSQWNEKEQQNMVRTLLEFIVKQRTTFDKHFSNNIGPTLTFLIFNENYDSHLEIFLKRLSQSANYSDDSKFAHLLKMILQESKKHFVRGRIGKMLIILNELKRHNLLTRLYGTILVTEPEAFHSLYQPIEEEGVIPADLHFLLERDSYRLTRLHGAAFYGNMEAVDEMLERIRQNLTDPMQKEVADKIINEIIARDEYGFTPFYVAAACGHKEIYQKMLAFLKQVLPDDTLEEHLIDEKGFVHRALSDAIDSENIQMFQLILNAVKKELGQKELIRVLNPEVYIHPRKQKSLKPTFFTRCKTKEFFNAMAKIVVTRDDNVADYTDLYDLVSQRYYPVTKRSLEDIDNENLQGLLLLKGVEDFTKSVLDIQSLSCGFELLSRNLLKHFTKDQLEQFVKTITAKHYKKKNRSWEFHVNSVHADDKETKDQILRQLNWGGGFWTNDDLVFEDEGNGTTIIYAERIVPRPSYWKDYIEEHLLRNTSYPDSIYMKLTSMNDGFPFRGRADCICECFKHLGDNSAKELLLHEETQGYIMIRFPQNMVKLMLNCLTQESQEEVKQKWKNNAPLFSKAFPLTSKILSEEHFPARISSAILHFYLEYGSNDHLKEFAKVVTVLHNIGQVQHSSWSYVFEKVDLRETNEILKIVSEKMEFLGKDGVKQLLLHEIDNVPFIIKAVSWGEDIDLWLAILPEEIKEEIQQFIQQKAPDFIEKAFCNPTAYFKTFSWGHYHKRLNTFTFFLSFSNEHQLQSFVPKITSKRVGGQQGVHEKSLWAEIFTHEWESNDEYGKKKTEDFAKMNKFMKMVSEKLGPNAVKELLLHQDGELLVVFYLALRGEEEMLETLLNYLPAKDKKKVQRKVDQFLDVTYKIPQDDED